MPVQIIAGFFAVASFGILLEFPKKFIFYAGLMGGICTTVYLTCIQMGLSNFMSTFISTLAVALASHIAARKLKAPTTIFLVGGILINVPGSGIYQSVYQLMAGNNAQSDYYFGETLQIAGAIALAIFIVESVYQTRLWVKRKREGKL